MNPRATSKLSERDFPGFFIVSRQTMDTGFFCINKIPFSLSMLNFAMDLNFFCMLYVVRHFKTIKLSYNWIKFYCMVRTDEWGSESLCRVSRILPFDSFLTLKWDFEWFSSHSAVSNFRHGVKSSSLWRDKKSWESQREQGNKEKFQICEVSWGFLVRSCIAIGSSRLRE